MYHLNNVLGFSKETLVALITTMEWCRRLNYLGKPEHPRASTSDDVECFFSMMRDALGQNFTTKEVKSCLRIQIYLSITTHALTVATVRAHLMTIEPTVE